MRKLRGIHNFHERRRSWSVRWFLTQAARQNRADVGTAVLVHGHGEAFEVEFVDYDGHTVALLTLELAQVRSLRAGDIPHARELASA